jgi:hypothetical protein
MDITQEHMQQFDAFLQPRQPGDIDLVQIVRSELLQFGLQDKLIAYYDNDSYIVQAKTKRPEIQRYLLNSYLNLQLMMSKRNSIEIRYGLLPAGPLEDWILIFKKRIAPFMADQDLPKEII